MVRHTLKFLQQMLQDFKSVSDHFGTLCIKGLNQSQNYVIFIQIVSCKCVFHNKYGRMSILTRCDWWPSWLCHRCRSCGCGNWNKRYNKPLNFTSIRSAANSLTFIYSNKFYRWFILEVNKFSLSAGKIL